MGKSRFIRSFHCYFRKGENLLLLFILAYDFFAVVVTAVFANGVRDFQLVAMRAFYQRSRRRLEVCKPGIGSLFGLFTLGYCHFYTPLSEIFTF